MSDQELELLPLGGLHIEDTSDRFELTKEEFNTVDVVFAESVVGDESLATRIASWLRAPLIVPGVHLILKGMGLIERLRGKGDGELIRKLVEEYDADVVVIDKSLHSSIRSSPYFWPLSNYALLFFILILYGEVGSLYFFLISILLINLSVFILYMAATLYGRDSKMALDIEQFAHNHSGNACAVIGKSHEKGLIDRLIDSHSVRIVSTSD